MLFPKVRPGDHHLKGIAASIHADRRARIASMLARAIEPLTSQDTGLDDVLDKIASDRRTAEVWAGISKLAMRMIAAVNKAQITSPDLSMYQTVCFFALNLPRSPTVIYRPGTDSRHATRRTSQREEHIPRNSEAVRQVSSDLDLALEVAADGASMEQLALSLAKLALKLRQTEVEAARLSKTRDESLRVGIEVLKQFAELLDFSGYELTYRSSHCER